MAKQRFSKQALIDHLHAKSHAHATHQKVDMGNGYAQFIDNGDLRSPRFWQRVEAYYRALHYTELANDIEVGLVPYVERESNHAAR